MELVIDITQTQNLYIYICNIEYLKFKKDYYVNISSFSLHFFRNIVLLQCTREGLADSSTGTPQSNTFVRRVLHFV